MHKNDQRKEKKKTDKNKKKNKTDADNICVNTSLKLTQKACVPHFIHLSITDTMKKSTRESVKYMIHQRVFGKSICSGCK